MKLELPWPPSLNRLWRTLLVGVCANCRKHAHGTLRPSREYEDYAVQLKVALLEQQASPIEGSPQLAITAHFYRPRKAGDLDNMLKAMLDVMGKGRVYADDSQVVELHAYRHDDKHKPRVELEVRELCTNATLKQEALDLGCTEAPMSAPSRNYARPVSNSADEPWTQKVRRLAQPAVVRNRSDDPEAA